MCTHESQDQMHRDQVGNCVHKLMMGYVHSSQDLMGKLRHIFVCYYLYRDWQGHSWLYIVLLLDLHNSQVLYYIQIHIVEISGHQIYILHLHCYTHFHICHSHYLHTVRVGLLGNLAHMK